MITFLSLSYFAHSTTALLFEVEEVLSDTEHPFHSSLQQDIASISASELQQFIDSNKYNHLIRENRDAELQFRLFYLHVAFAEKIAAMRRDSLINFNGRPAPYDHRTLCEIELDRNYMIDANELEYFNGGFKRATEVFALLPATDAINSSYWLIGELMTAEIKGTLKLRLDPLIHQHEDNFNPLMFKMQVYGRLLDWDRIKNLQQPEQLEFIAEFPSSSEILKTEIIWTPVDDEIHFTCEELPKIDVLHERGSRYFHAILQKSTGMVIHCDGAIRFYNEDEYNDRLQYHIKSSKVTRVGKRVKVFQADGEIPRSSLINFITTFFVWNHDVLDYFDR